ncbi:NUDIX domain-containing protein, partial [Nocardia cyriacigeorgica]|uniref:NUDIX domain-containing protein n=1 Tax=Nocardia cyriacigeorgica TaxID=135487 RepID=UPI00313B5001
MCDGADGCHCGRRNAAQSVEGQLNGEWGAPARGTGREGEKRRGGGGGGRQKGRILLQRRADSGLWALPGGAMEMTDSLPGCAVREVKEETGLD